MKKLLIADDNEQALYLMRVLLEGNGFRVETATNGAEALEMARREPPDLIVTDILMPVMDGFSLCREWKRDEVLRKIPLVFYTATYTDPRDEKLATDLGGDRFIVKPQEPEMFLGVLREVLVEREEGRLVASEAPAAQEAVLLREYNQVLISKLEDKMVQLERVNLALERESAKHRLVAETLRESEERYRGLVETSPDAVTLTDLEGKILFCNRQAAETHGFASPTEMIGVDTAELIAPEDRPLAAENMRLTLEQGQVRNAAHTLLRRDGSRFDAELSASLIRSVDGSPKSLMAITRDVTERKRAEEEIRRLNEELEGRVAERTRELQSTIEELESFSYSISHDLRAPLRALDGFSAILLREQGDRVDGRGRHYLERIQEAARQMSDLMDDLLGLSKVTRRELVRERVDLGEIARRVADGLLSTEPGRQVEFEIGGGMEVDGDPHLLRLAMENLIGNAWKFTGPRGDARIEVGVEERGGERVYYVRDNGVGFDMAHADKLFGPFQRMHGAAEFPGTGIGLATVRRIVRRHGGRIWAEAGAGEGATFYFTLWDVPDGQ